jgi:hypothetical protein
MIFTEAEEIIELDRESDFFYLDRTEEEEDLCEEEEFDMEELYDLFCFIEMNRQINHQKAAAELRSRDQKGKKPKKQAKTRVSQDEIEIAEKNMNELLKELEAEEKQKKSAGTKKQKSRRKKN